MDIEQTVILGTIQGLTEFLPISSSGHLVIFQHLIGLREPELLLDIALHVGTLLAVLTFFWADIRIMVTESRGCVRTVLRERELIRQIQKSPHAALAFWILMGMIPTALLGVVFNLFLQEMFGSTRLVGFMLLATGSILGASRLVRSSSANKKEVGLISAMVVGLAQGAAIIPGISRSGATIVCGLFCGLDRDMAGRFSFLLSIPAILGASLLKFDLAGITEIGLIPLFAGVLVSFFVGLVALKITMGMLRRGRLYCFSPYCFLAGVVALFL